MYSLILSIIFGVNSRPRLLYFSKLAPLAWMPINAVISLPFQLQCPIIGEPDIPDSVDSLCSIVCLSGFLDIELPQRALLSMWSSRIFSVIKLYSILVSGYPTIVMLGLDILQKLRYLGVLIPTFIGSLKETTANSLPISISQNSSQLQVDNTSSSLISVSYLNSFSQFWHPGMKTILLVTNSLYLFQKEWRAVISVVQLMRKAVDVEMDCSRFLMQISRPIQSYQLFRSPSQSMQIDEPSYENQLLCEKLDQFGDGSSDNDIYDSLLFALSLEILINITISQPQPQTLKNLYPLIIQVQPALHLLELTFISQLYSPSNMGQTQATLDQFYSKYIPNSNQDFILSPNSNPVSPQNDILYAKMQFKTHLEFLDSLRVYQRGVRQCRFILQIEDLFYNDFGRYSDILATLPKTGLPLLKILRNRSKQGNTAKKFREADASYMIECVARGLKELSEIQASRFILTPTTILLCSDGFFKVVEVPCPSGDFRYFNQPAFLMIDSNTSDFQRVSDNWVNFFMKMDGKFNRNATNLLILGLIALNMLDLDFKLQQLFNQRGQFMHVRLMERINQVKDQKLKQKIWMLTNEYQRQRTGIYRELDPIFDRKDISSRMMLKYTLLQFDLTYVQDVLNHQRSRIKVEIKTQPIKTVVQPQRQNPPQVPTFCPIPRQQCKMVKTISQPPPKMPVIRFSYSNKPITDVMTASCPIPKININQSLTVSKELELSIERTLPINKLKSQMSEETQHSLAKNEEGLNSLKEVDTTTRLLSKIDSISKQAVETIPHQQASEEKDKEDHDHSNLLSSEGESIIFMDVQGSDEDSQSATQENIDDFFQDIRAKSYAIDRQIQRIDEPPSPVVQNHLSNNILQEIIREQSFEQSQIGEIDLMSEEEP